jgi:hypothetical protein
MREIVIFSILILISCSQVILGPDPDNTYLNNFNLLWKNIDQNYPFFGYKHIDWDSIYANYKNKIPTIKSDDEFFNLLGKMCNELRDGHVSLKSKTMRSQFHYETGYPSNSPVNTIAYIDSLDISLWPYIYGRVKNMDNVLYLRILTFNGTNFSNDEQCHKRIDNILKSFHTLNAVIIDVRDNDGGMSNNADVVASRFVFKKSLWGYIRYRNGSGRDNFTKWYPQYISPSGKGISVPVCILTNRKCFSSCETFIMRMSVLPNVTLIGANTGGGTSIPILQELINGWSYRVSSAATAHPDYSITEETGITPDISVSISKEDSIAGRDLILEKAFEYLIN